MCVCEGEHMVDVIGELVESASLWQTAVVDEWAVKSDELGIVVVDA